MLYCGATASLCALEVLAHSAMLPTDMIVVPARIPNGLSMQIVEESDLPLNLEQPDTFQEDAGPRNGLDKERSYRGAVCTFGHRSE